MSAKVVTVSLLALLSIIVAKRRVPEGMREAVKSVNAKAYGVPQRQIDVATKEVASTLADSSLNVEQPSLLELAESSGSFFPHLAQLPKRPKLALAAKPLQVRMDSDRCYYGDVDANGMPVVLEKKQRGPSLKPSPDLGPAEVVAEQFGAFSSGTLSDLEDAFAFVSPKIKKQHNVDVQAFRKILEGIRLNGIIGCTSWEVMGEPLYPSEETAEVGVKIIPKPLAGCVRISGVGDQGGITWPAYYKWQLGRPVSGPLAGCWLLEQMIPVSPDNLDKHPVFMRSAASGDARSLEILAAED